MKPKIRLEIASLSVASFPLESGASDGYGPASVITETQGGSCGHYCGPDDQHTGPTIPGSGC